MMVHLQLCSTVLLLVLGCHAAAAYAHEDKECRLWLHMHVHPMHTAPAAPAAALNQIDHLEQLVDNPPHYSRTEQEENHTKSLHQGTLGSHHLHYSASSNSGMCCHPITAPPYPHVYSAPPAAAAAPACAALLNSQQSRQQKGVQAATFCFATISCWMLGGTTSYLQAGSNQASSNCP